MYVTAAQKRIMVAVVFCATLISTTLFLRGSNDKTPTNNTATASDLMIVEAPARTAIPVSDSNNDGVPDWQEELQTTSAVNFDNSTSSLYLPPNTLTDQFARNFFEQMVRNKNNGEFGRSDEEMANIFSDALIDQAQDEPITKNDIVISNDNSLAALTNYGEALANIIISSNQDTQENELLILERAINSNNPQELEKLTIKIDIYKDILAKTLELESPSVVSTEHLLLLNSYQAILEDITAMQKAFDDPLYALIRLKRYQEDASGLAIAISSIYTKLIEKGSNWETGSSVWQVIKIQ